MVEPKDRNDVWVIDTSSVLEIRRKLAKEKHAEIYRRLGQLVDDGKLFFPKQVLNELKRQTAEITKGGKRDLPYEWAKQDAEQATRHGTTHAALREVLAVEGVAQLLDPDKAGVEEADPYVLALAHHLIGVGLFARVITEDRVNAPDKIALASACGIVGIPVVPVRAFLLNRRIWTGAWGT